jgi:hypothetical protein
LIVKILFFIKKFSLGLQEGMAQVVECLPGRLKALSPNCNTAVLPKNKNKKDCSLVLSKFQVKVLLPIFCA